MLRNLTWPEAPEGLGVQDVPAQLVEAAASKVETSSKNMCPQEEDTPTVGNVVAPGNHEIMLRQLGHAFLRANRNIRKGCSTTPQAANLMGYMDGLHGHRARGSRFSSLFFLFW